MFAFAGQAGGSGTLGVIAVADGVGGIVSGEVASRTAIAGLEAAVGAWRGHESGSADDLAQLLGAAVDAGRSSLKRRGSERPEEAEMATTLTALAVAGGHAELVHLGDSRAYHVRGGTIQRLTTDHTVVEQLIAAGHLSRDDAHFYRGGQMLTRYLSGRATFPLERGSLLAAPGDLFVICSDGFYQSLDEETLLSAYLAAAPQTQAALDGLMATLIAMALERGGDDNVSIAAAGVLS